MTTPASQIAASDINTENGYAATQQMSWDDSIVRTLAQITTPQSQISLLDLRSKTRTISLVYSAPKQNASLLTDFPGQPTSARWQVTINPGVYLWSDSTSIAGLTTGGPFPAGLTIINNGYIMGKGGSGGSRGPGAAGGPAISLGVNTTIDNTYPTAYIGGGGGGGAYGYGDGGGGATPFRGGGGGAGGGAGGNGYSDTSLRSSGGSGGSIGNAGGSSSGAGGGAGGGGGSGTGGGGGGGRIFPGAGGGNGGSGSNVGGNSSFGGTAAGGGGWGASGGSAPYAGGFGAAGAGGRAVQRNGFNVTFVNGNTTRVFGAIS